MYINTNREKQMNNEKVAKRREYMRLYMREYRKNNLERIAVIDKRYHSKRKTQNNQGELHADATNPQYQPVREGQV
jgi:hypothetical protein